MFQEMLTRSYNMSPRHSLLLQMSSSMCDTKSILVHERVKTKMVIMIITKVTQNNTGMYTKENSQQTFEIYVKISQGVKKTKIPLLLWVTFECYTYSM